MRRRQVDRCAEPLGLLSLNSSQEPSLKAPETGGLWPGTPARTEFEVTVRCIQVVNKSLFP